MKQTYDFEGKVVYLSGPVTGIEGFNAEAFERARVDIMMNRGAMYVYDPVLANSPKPGDVRPHADYMIRCINKLTQYRGWGSMTEPVFDVIVMLDGWRDSAGAVAECKVAHAIGIDVVEWRDA